MIHSRRMERSVPEAADARGDSGYSLVELLVSLVVMTTLMGGLYLTLFQSQATFDVQMDAAELRQTARVAADTLSVELRMAGADIGNLPQILTIARPNELAFNADIDNDSPDPPCSAAFETAVDGGAEGIRYELNAGFLTRQVDCWNGAAWTNEYMDQPVVGNLANAAVARPLFRYFDEDGVEMVPPAAGLTAAQMDAVRLIEVAFVLDDGVLHVVADGISEFQIVTQVKLRNAGIE